MTDHLRDTMASLDAAREKRKACRHDQGADMVRDIEFKGPVERGALICIGCGLCVGNYVSTETFAKERRA